VGREHALTSFFNELSVLKEDKSQRLVVTYGAGRRVTQRESIPAPLTRTCKECADGFVTIPIDEFRTS
jgi:hypothetical protein